MLKDKAQWTRDQEVKNRDGGMLTDVCHLAHVLSEERSDDFCLTGAIELSC